MKKLFKLSLSLSVFIFAILAISNCAFATTSTNIKSIVNKDHNGIKITKSAKWYKDKIGVATSEEKSLAQIDIKVDLTDMDVSDTKGQSTDVVFVLDVSNSMKAGEKLDNLKKVGEKLFSDFLELDCGSRRVGIITFATEYKEVLPLSSDLSKVTSTIRNTTIDEDINKSQTNLQGGIYAAQQVLKKSTADNKIMIILTDGNANKEILEKGPDVAIGENPVFAAVNQAEMAKKSISNLQIMTIGLDIPEWGIDRLKEIATPNSDNEKLNFAVNTGDVNLEEYFVGVFANINYMAKKVTYEHMLVDYIPYGLEIYNNEVWCDDKDVDITYDEEKIIWNMGIEQLENKVYNMGFIVAVDFKVLSSEYIDKYDCINTNGSYMEVYENSSNSLMFTYIKNKEKMEIGLKSPQLKYVKDKQVEEEKKDAEKESKEEPKKEPELKEEPVDDKEFKELEPVTIQEVERVEDNKKVVLIRKIEEKKPKIDNIVNKKDIFVSRKLDKTPKTGYTDKEMRNLEGPYRFSNSSVVEKSDRSINVEVIIILTYVFFTILSICCINKKIRE